MATTNGNHNGPQQQIFSNPQSRQVAKTKRLNCDLSFTQPTLFQAGIQAMHAALLSAIFGVRREARTS
jgi:hypothetical protein